MTYTRAWDEAAPVGASTPAANIDDEFRNLKVDLRERMNVLVDDFTADPIVAKAVPIAGVTFSGATPKIIGGSTYTVFRNAADTSNNFIIFNSGVVGTRGVASDGNFAAGTLILGNGGIAATGGQLCIEYDGGIGLAYMNVLKVDTIYQLLTIGGGVNGYGYYVQVPVISGSYPGASPQRAGFITVDFNSGAFVWYGNGVRYMIAGTLF